jgi:hypothetical protein
MHGAFWMTAGGSRVDCGFYSRTRVKIGTAPNFIRPPFAGSFCFVIFILSVFLDGVLGERRFSVLRAWDLAHDWLISDFLFQHCERGHWAGDDLMDKRSSISHFRIPFCVVTICACFRAVGGHVTFEEGLCFCFWSRWLHFDTGTPIYCTSHCFGYIGFGCKSAQHAVGAGHSELEDEY